MVTALSFLAFTALVAYVSWRKTRHDDHESSSGYFLAGRSLGWVVIAGSLLLTNLSTEQLVGMNGGGFEHGMQLMAWEVWSAIAIVLMALVFLPRYLKGGVATVSEFLARRYDRRVGTLISVLLLLSLLTNLLPFVLYSGAVFMKDVFAVDQLFSGEAADENALLITVIALGVIGSVYAIFGGLKAVAVSDTMNGIGLLIGGAMIPFFGLVELGDLHGDGGFVEGVRYLTTHQPERLNPVAMDESANVPFSTLFTGMLFITTYYWCTNQAIVQRTFGAKSLSDGQKGVLFAAFMKLLAPLYVVLPGIIAFHLFAVHQQDGQEYVIEQFPAAAAIEATTTQDDQTRTFVFEQGEDGRVADLDDTFLNLKDRVGETVTVGEDESAVTYRITSVVAENTIVSRDADSAVVLSQADPDTVLPLAMKDKSYGRLAIRVVPKWLLGFFAAVIFGAILSSFNSGLNSAATLFSMDIYKSVFRHEASEAQMVHVGKIIGVILAMGSICVAPMIATAGSGLFDLMKQLAAIFNIPILSLVIVGMFSRRTPSIAAWAAVLVGVVFYSYFSLYCDNEILGTRFHWLHVAGMNFVLIVGVMLVLTAISPRETAWEQPYSEDVDITPWKYAVPVGLLILVIIAVMYWSMSKLG